MGTDYWPTQPDANTAGSIVSHFEIGFFTAAGTVTEAAPQKWGTGASGAIKCQDATAIGDAFGYALKGASTGYMVPVLVEGVFKAKAAGNINNITTGDFVMNSATYTVSYTVNESAWDEMKVFGGSSYVLGIAMQPSTTADDYILVLVGRSM